MDSKLQFVDKYYIFDRWQINIHSIMYCVIIELKIITMNNMLSSKLK